MSILTEFRAPWAYDDVTGHICTQPDEGRPHGAVVAHVGHHPGFIRQEVIGPLAATAPELLDALIALRANIGAASLSRNPYGKALRDQADAAIAKAKGGVS
ncbi:hypothetical protein [Sphingobium yanoikuyae]|uniref:hypothetical protein n=1 Tax=Sphingobium yanoikuyae TaxID=13690 RepID=UPI0035C84605